MIKNGFHFFAIRFYVSTLEKALPSHFSVPYNFNRDAYFLTSFFSSVELSMALFFRSSPATGLDLISINLLTNISNNGLKTLLENHFILAQ